MGVIKAGRPGPQPRFQWCPSRPWWLKRLMRADFLIGWVYGLGHRHAWYHEVGKCPRNLCDHDPRRVARELPLPPGMAPPPDRQA
ncbi:hypothetical protein GCM10010171_05460 [Actinokineospora fastidiosa]|uniref:Uncharacterized protein n=1 Tax=Actinokineospora fastidiosa TaxID=1816 RepID=A0A918L7K6_9PSEU|nr:hypothetical protein GCM10010171_05460 [Actinokineospora fastidiosa]